MFLTPYENGGYIRGGSFQQAVKKLPQGSLNGVRVLDYCCGRGDLGIYLAQRGAVVSGIDLSCEAISVANFKAGVNDIEIDFREMDAEDMQFEDNTFDFIIGFEALHHVIIFPKSMSELHRILKPRGRAIFAENWGADNPLLQFIRNNLTLKRANSRDRGEIVLADLVLEEHVLLVDFDIHVSPISLLTVSRKTIKSLTIQSIFARVETPLVSTMPWLGKFCGEAIIELTKRA
jgi:SAM-dependent methyltransferase